MQSVRIVLILLLNVAWLTTTTQASRSASAQERFLTEYPEASKKLENYYNDVKLYFYKTTPRNGETQEYEFFRNGRSIRLVQLTGKAEESYYAYVVDPDLIFKLKQKSMNGPFVVTDLGKGSSSDYEEWANLILSKAAVARAPYAARLPGSIHDLFTAKALKLKSVQESSDGTIRVDWEGVGPRLPRSEGSFSFLPDACWAVRDYTIRYVGRMDNRTKQALPNLNLDGHIDYKGSDNGVPIVHALKTWMGQGEKKSPEFLFEVQDIVHEEIPKEEFTLESFGVRTRPAPPQVPITYYLFALSALFASMVLIIRYIRNRSYRTSTGT